MKLPAVFISRSPDRSNEFIEAVSPISEKIICQSFIHFEPLPITEIPQTNWIFFYSQKGVEYFHAAATSLGSEISGKIAAFGSRTADKLIQLGYKVDFVGTAEAQSTAEQFGQLTKRTSVLFVKGKTSLDSIKKHLPSSVEATDLVVYSNFPLSIILSDPPDILCFTSPMNLRAYFASNPIREHQKILAIGTSTAQAALQLDISSVYISKTPSIVALADLVKSLITDPNKVSDIKPG